MTTPRQDRHPDFDLLADSWELSLRADGYAGNTLRSYRKALENLADWLVEEHPGVGPVKMDRNQVRAWVVHIRDSRSSGTARSWFAGVRHFCRWMLVEQEAEHDATDGIKTPRPNDQKTPIPSKDDLKALLRECAGDTFVARRDNAIVMVMLDAGLRLAEISGLTVDDVDIRERMVFVEGKGSNRSGPRRRAGVLGVKAARALDRYLRERRKHPFAHTKPLWLGDRGRNSLSPDGIDRMLQRRAERAGIGHIHPHMLRHAWADEFRAAGGSEGDLMVLGGWRSRAMLDRYGRTNAEKRAKESGRQLSFGDRL
jgi:site-specific recombinase XerD